MRSVPVSGMEGRASRDIKSGAIVMHDSSAYRNRALVKANDKNMKDEMKRLRKIGSSLNNRISELENIINVVLHRFDEVNNG